MNKREREDEDNFIPDKRFKFFEGQKISPTNPAFLNLLDKMIGFDNFPKETHYYLQYFFTKNIQHFKLVNNHDNKQLQLKSFERELNYTVSQHENDFREIIRDYLLLHNNIEFLTNQIKLLKNNLYSDTDTVKNLSKDLLSLNINIINSFDNKENLEMIVQEHSRIYFHLSITNKRIQDISSQLEKLENERTAHLNNLQTCMPKFIDLKVKNKYIFEKIKEYIVKLRDLYKYQVEIREVSVIKSFVKTNNSKFFNDKINLKEILHNEYSNLYYFFKFCCFHCYINYLYIWN